MRSLSRVVVAPLVAALLVAPALGARAQVEPCDFSQPDRVAPLVYDFKIGTATPPEAGTEVRVVADERHTCASTITRVVLTVDPNDEDGSHLYEVDMDPVDGDFGLPEQVEEVRYVFSPTAFDFGGRYTLRLVAHDGAGNAGSGDDPYVEHRVYYFSPVLTGECRGLGSDILC